MLLLHVVRRFLLASTAMRRWQLATSVYRVALPSIEARTVLPGSAGSILCKRFSSSSQLSLSSSRCILAAQAKHRPRIHPFHSQTLQFPTQNRFPPPQ